MNNKKSVTVNMSEIDYKLYKDGFDWFMAGKDLDKAVNKVYYLGHLTSLKDIVVFYRGYQAGMIHMGIECGYNGTSLDEIDDKYKQNKYFLSAYKRGYKRGDRERIRNSRK